jgi:DNA invertase Pin-like site-specific DNA recombinase
MKIGYARVSTDEQDTALQLDALNVAGCERLYSEHFSGKQKSRPDIYFAPKNSKNYTLIMAY